MAAGEGTPLTKEISAELREVTARFFRKVGTESALAPQHNVTDAFSYMIGGVLKVLSIERGKISCLLTVKPPVVNVYGGMHGGAVASVAERVARACAKTVVGEDKDIFLGELSISYLSAAASDAEVVVDGFVVRNITIVAVNFQLKKSGQQVYMSRATFYNRPASKL